MRITLALCLILSAGTVCLATPAEERSDSDENSQYVLALPVNDDEVEPIAEESQSSVATEVPPDQTVTKQTEKEETNEKEQPVLVLVNEDSTEKEQSNEGTTTEKPETSESNQKPPITFRRPKFDEIVKILGLPTPMKPKPIPPEKPKMFSPFSKVLPRIPTPFGNIPFPLPLKRDGNRLFNLPDILHVATSLIKRALVEETQSINKDDKDDDDDDDDDDDGPMVLPIPVPTLRRPSMMFRSITALPPRPRPVPIPVPRPIRYIPHPPPMQRAPPMPSYLLHPAQTMPRLVHHNFIPQMMPSHPQHFQPRPPPHMLPYRQVPQFIPIHQSHPVMAPRPRLPMHHQPRHMPMPFRPAPRPMHPHQQLMRQQASVHPVLVLFAPVPVPVPVMHHPRSMHMPVPMAAPSAPQRIIHVPVPAPPQQEEVIFVQHPVAIQQREEYEPNSSEREEVVFLYPEPAEPRPAFVPAPPKHLYRKPTEGPSPKLKLLREILMAKQALNSGVPYKPQPASATLPLVRQIKMLQIIQHQLRFLPFLRPRA